MKGLPGRGLAMTVLIDKGAHWLWDVVLDYHTRRCCINYDELKKNGYIKALGEVEPIQTDKFLALTSNGSCRVQLDSSQIGALTVELVGRNVAPRDDAFPQFYETYRELTALFDLWNMCLDAIDDGRLKVAKSGRVVVESFNDFVNTYVICNSRDEEPRAPYRFGHDWFENDTDKEGSQPQDQHETPMMAIVRRGRMYWWGGLGTANQYRGTQDEIRAWFEDNGADKSDAATFAKMIAPDWVLRGGRRDGKERVAKLDDA